MSPNKSRPENSNIFISRVSAINLINTLNEFSHSNQIYKNPKTVRIKKTKSSKIHPKWFESSQLNLLDRENLFACTLDDARMIYVPLGVWLTGAYFLWLQGCLGQNCKIGIVDSGIMPHLDLPSFLLSRDREKIGNLEKIKPPTL